MLKGINRNIIVVRTPLTSRFEAAYFILKKGTRGDSREKLLEEANRMIAQGERRKPWKRRRLVYALWFALGAMIGAGVSALLCLVAL